MALSWRRARSRFLLAVAIDRRVRPHGLRTLSPHEHDRRCAPPRARRLRRRSRSRSRSSDRSRRGRARRRATCSRHSAPTFGTRGCATPRGAWPTAYAELLTPEPFHPTTFPNDGGYDELVSCASIPFHSLCKHHLLPFDGVAHVGYLPGRADRRAVEAGARGRALRARPAGAGAPDDADRRLAAASSSSPRASASCSRPSTSACRCAACRSSAPGR